MPKPLCLAARALSSLYDNLRSAVLERFFTARRFTDLEDLNAQALMWCTTVASFAFR